MNGYEKYRDSNVMWLGGIPAHWELARGKYLFRTRKDINRGNQCSNVLSLTLDGVINNDIDNPIGLSPRDYASYQIFDKDNLVFKLIDLENISTSRVGLVHERGIMSPAYIRLINRYDCNIRYFYYQYYDLYLRHIYNGLGNGVRSTLNARDLLNIPITIPPIEEQEQIARFLDWKISGIDRLIAIRKDELTNLEDLKKAVITRAVTRGNWEHVKIKRLFKIFSGATPDSENPNFWDGNIIWITPVDFQTKDKYIYHGAKYITESGFKACSTSLVPSGTIIFTKRAPVGKVAISKSELCTNQGCLSCVPLEGVAPEYFYYVMSICTDEFESLSAGATFKEISLSKFKNVSLPCPPISEQKRIAGYLDKICSEIDSAITNFTAQIDTLKELKARLISDTVTGKIDVRNIPVPEQEKIL